MNDDTATLTETKPANEMAGPATSKPPRAAVNGNDKPSAVAFKPKVDSNGAPERITRAGAIRIENEDTLRAVPLFYYEERNQWFSADGNGRFTKISDSQTKTIVAEYGFNKNAKDGQGNTPAERAMIWLMQNKRVAFAGALAGYPAGVHESGVIRFLVTESPAPIMPATGKCETIRTLIESLLFDEDHDQKTFFYLWASESFAAYHRRITEGDTDKFRHCPALAIFGPRGCGKSALIDLILTPLFGGRKADPMNYLREAKFNKDLFAASLLTLDDKGASANLAERRQRGEGIKDLIWKPEQRMEGKGVDAVNLRPFWRLVIAGNDDDAGLQVCPALSPSLEDKLLILRAQMAEALPATHDERDNWAARIRSELPAFAAYLLSWRPPEGLTLDPRTRIANFQHPHLVSALRELQPEMRLLELIETLGLIDDGAPLWEGTATEFEKAMRAKDGQGLLERIFTATGATGRMLSELERVLPGRVKKTDRQGCSHYRIFRAQKIQIT